MSLGQKQRKALRKKRPEVRKSGPPHRKLGRPCGSFKDVDTTKLIADIAKGVPVPIACAAVGISERTVRDWLDQRPEFAQALAAKKQETILEWLSIVLSGTKEKDWRGAAWALERCYPDAFAPKPQIALGVQNNTFTISVEKAKEIENMRAELLPRVNERFAALANGDSNGTEATS